jgi:hypothetical protein
MKNIIKIFVILLMIFISNSSFACSDWWDYSWWDGSSSYESSIVDWGNYNGWTNFWDNTFWTVNIDGWNINDSIENWSQQVPTVETKDPATLDALKFFNWDNNTWNNNDNSLNDTNNSWNWLNEDKVKNAIDEIWEQLWW